MDRFGYAMRIQYGFMKNIHTQLGLLVKVGQMCILLFDMSIRPRTFQISTICCTTGQQIYQVPDGHLFEESS